MGLFSNQFQSVIEWSDDSEGILLWKWQDTTIKKNSRLVIRPGQQAVFLNNGNVEGIFTEEGRYDIESDIIPFLTTLSSFSFGFNTPLRAEVIFINATEQTVKWGTKNPLNIPVAGLPGGMPIRSFGTFSCRVAESDLFIAKIAGAQKIFTVNDVKDRMTSILDQLLMSHIAREGNDMFNLQADAAAIGRGILADLDMELRKIGLAATDFRIDSFSYPEKVREMQEKAAGQAMIGDMGKYAQVAAADGMANGAVGANIAGAAVQMQMGMQMAQEMMGQNAAPAAGSAASTAANGAVPNFCPNCGKPANGMKFCGNCGFKLA